MKLIELTQGLWAMVDATDYDFLKQWKWSALKSRKTFYAVRTDGSRYVYMHRVLCPGAELVDHRDRDGLNNRRKNLRPASDSQSMANRGPQCNNVSGFVGVYWETRRGKWCAQIKQNRVRHFLGYFSNPKAAARACAMPPRYNDLGNSPG